MPRKTIIIFITVFIIVGVVILGFYFKNKSSNTTAGDTATSGYNSFNPFSSGSSNSSSDNSTNPSDNNSTSPNPSGEGEQALIPSKFHKITDFAVAGATYFEDTRLLPQAEATATPVPAPTTTKNKKKVVVKAPASKFEMVPSLRYVERATGHVYQMYLDNKVEGKISNSTVPSISEVIFDGSAQSLIYRYISSDNGAISSFIGTLGGTKSDFLPSNIIDISLSPDKNRFFYLIKTASGVTGATRAFSDTKVSQIFSSPYSEWLSQWVTKDTIYLTTKASSSVNGSVFSLSVANGSMAKVFGGVRGLTTLANNDGSLILYSTSLASGPRLGVFDVKKHTTNNIDVYSLPEKCVWSTDNITVYCGVPNNLTSGTYPDSWYQGLTSFDDNFMKINVVSGIVSTISDNVSGTVIDGTNLFLSKSENQLFFINKKDSTLWALDLK